MKCYEFEIKRRVRIFAHDKDEAYEEIYDMLSDEEEIINCERDYDYDCED